MSDPQLSVIAAPNFRDLAEFVGASLPLRRGVLFRSDHLGALDAHDARQIQALGVRRVLDFRGERERMQAVCALPDVQVHSLAIEPTIVQVMADLMAAGHELTGEDVVVHMQDTYRGFVRHHAPQFTQFFQLLLESDEPTIFHCTAGKDRTGFAAALVLHVLGASHEDILRDYLLTNQRLKLPPGTRWGLSPEVAQVLWSVRPEFLQAAFDAVVEDHGSLDAYLRNALGIGERERAQLRKAYLVAPR